MRQRADLVSLVAHRGQILHLLDDPDNDATAYEFIEDGILLVDEGYMSACKPAASLLDKLPPEHALWNTKTA